MVIKIPSQVKIVKHISACIFFSWMKLGITPSSTGWQPSSPTPFFLFLFQFKKNFFFKEYMIMTQDIQG